MTAKQDAKQSRPETKRTYSRPRIVSREKLEVIAGPCVKDGGNPACSAGPLQS